MELSKIDKDFIDESIEEANIIEERESVSKQYPKYQMSKFVGKDYQVVVREDSFDSFMQACTKMQTLVKQLSSKVESQQATGETTGGHLNAKCETCGTKMVYKSGTSKKTGKKWEALMCPNAEKGKPGHDPVWL